MRARPSTATSAPRRQQSRPRRTSRRVTYTAMVTARATARQDPVPSSPTGTVSFLEGGNTVCTVTLIANATAPRRPPVDRSPTAPTVWPRSPPSTRTRRQLHQQLGKLDSLDRSISGSGMSDVVPINDRCAPHHNVVPGSLPPTMRRLPVTNSGGGSRTSGESTPASVTAHVGVIASLEWPIRRRTTGTSSPRRIRLVTQLWRHLWGKYRPAVPAKVPASAGCAVREAITTAEYPYCPWG